MAFKSTVEAMIKGQSEGRTALIYGQKFLHRQKLDQVLIQNTPKGGQKISEHCNLRTCFICTK